MDTPNTVKQEYFNRNEPQNNNNRNTTHVDHAEQTLTPEEEMNIENLRRIMSKK